MKFSVIHVYSVDYGCIEMQTSRNVLYFFYNFITISLSVHTVVTFSLDMKSLIPKGAKSIFYQNRVTNNTTLVSLPPTFRTHFWSEYNKQKEDIVNFILSFP